MRNIIMVCLLILTTHSFSAVYHYQDKNGSNVYTDSPSNHDATEVTITKTETEESVSQPTPEQPVVTKKNIKKPYTIFTIDSPKDKDTIQNQPSITVSFKLEPELQAEDKIQLFLDGKPHGNPAHSSSFVLEHIDRGTHQLYATLLEDQKVLKQTNAVTIYVHYAHVKGN